MNKNEFYFKLRTIKFNVTHIDRPSAHQKQYLCFYISLIIPIGLWHVTPSGLGADHRIWRTIALWRPTYIWQMMYALIGYVASKDVLFKSAFYLKFYIIIEKRYEVQLLLPRFEIIIIGHVYPIEN